MGAPLDIEGLRQITYRGQYIPLGEAARMAGVQTQTLRKRLRRLDARHGTRILRKWGSSRYAHYRVDLQALKDVNEGSPNEAALEAMSAKVEMLERQLNSLRAIYLELRQALTNMQSA